MISIFQQFEHINFCTWDDWKDFTHLLTLHGICVLLFLPAQLHIKSNILRRMHNVYLHICITIFGGWFSQKNKTHSLSTFWKGGILSPPSWVEVSEGKTWLTWVWVIFYKVRCLAELCTNKAHSLSSTSYVIHFSWKIEKVPDLKVQSQSRTCTQRCPPRTASMTWTRLDESWNLENFLLSINTT